MTAVKFLEFRTCERCGEVFPIRSKYARRAKWCSERCRKAQYDQACIDCGARVDGTTPSKASGRCRRCAQTNPENPARVRELEQRRMIEAMWADGYTGRAIMKEVGLRYNRSLIGMWRSRGYDLPHRRTPEQLARILVGSDERMAKARAARES